MNSVKKYGKLIFHPFLPLILFLGLVITTLHLEIPVLADNHIELILFLGAILLSIFHITFIEKAKFSYRHPAVLAALLALLYLISPILTSFFTGDHLLVLDDGEFKSLSKILLLTPFLFYYVRQLRYHDLILNSVILFYSILGVYFLYRFLILKEVREYDLRPALQIRHGDANFLCTFFIMMVPLSLLQAWKAIQKNKKSTALIHASTGLFFMSCALLTESRMGIIALGVGILYLLTRRFDGSARTTALRITSLIIFSFVVGFGAIQSGLANRLSEINDKSSSDRLLTYMNGLKVYVDFPVFGAGMHKARNYYYSHSQYPNFQSESKQLEIHNTYLNVLAELGIFGLLAFFAILIWVIRSVLQAKEPTRYFLMTSLLILLFSGLTIGVSYKDLIFLHLFLLAALSCQQTEAEAI